MKTNLKALRPEDWPSIRAIYEEGIATGLATFETHAPEWADWDQNHLVQCRLAAWRTGEDGIQQIAGWTALSPVSRRKVYSGVAEISIYIAGWARGQGVGKDLLAALIVESERVGIWTLQASIFAENNASLTLHRSCGFREVGRRERIAQRDGVWHDTMILERRSKVVGS
jgi:L-amino acid N-acyltransferase YncA